MTETDNNSIGRVDTQFLQLDLPDGGFRLENDRALPAITVAYETYGELSESRDNVVFVCHALTGNAHAAGLHEPPDPDDPVAWWDEMIGPGKGIDTDFYHVVCANILGGCKGTTGPASDNPETGKPYGSAFPEVSVGDIVDVHRLLLQQLGIERLAAVIGGSFGGMQVIEWAIRYPETLERGIVIASSASLSSQALAFDLVGRKAITSDPDFQGGDYYDSGRSPSRGLSLARKVGHITYLSREIMAHKFGREKWQEEHEDLGSSAGSESRLDRFYVDTYLDHQGDKFTHRFDANSYLRITQAMDEYDVVAAYGELHEAFKRVESKLLVVAVSSDWLFPPEQSEALAHSLLKAGKPVSYCLLSAPYGHDAFLLDVEYLSDVIRSFLPWVGPSKETIAKAAAKARETRKDQAIIQGIIPPGSKVLDLGCGNGDLLSGLAEGNGGHRLGLEIDIEHVIQVIERGHNVFQADIDGGLAMIPDGRYDYAVLGETLQAVRKPRLVLEEMLRVANEGILSFSNYGSWKRRLRIFCRGRVPRSADQQDWHETTNLRPFSYADFVDLCGKDRIRILDVIPLSNNWLGKLLIKIGLVNLGASAVVVRIAPGLIDGGDE